MRFSKTSQIFDVPLCTINNTETSWEFHALLIKDTELSVINFTFKNFLDDERQWLGK